MLQKEVVMPCNSLWDSYRSCRGKQNDHHFKLRLWKPKLCCHRRHSLLPRLNESFKSLATVKYICTLESDRTTGKWKLVMQTDNRLKTAFASHKWLCEFLARSFGLASSPASFKRLVKIVPCELSLEKRLVHLDNAILFEEP